MPNRVEYVAPARFHEHAGVLIFRAYKDDDWDLPLTYWFTTDADEDPSFEFDVRDIVLKLFERGLLSPECSLDGDSDFKAVLAVAIDHQQLKRPKP